jgi:uncharacterized protein YndB with AHSA1/START domain
VNTPLGTIEAEDDRFRLTLVRRLTARIEAVWQALTEPAELLEWLGDVELEPQEGGEIQIAFDADDVVRGRVRCFEPPHVFEFTWSDRADHEDPSVVRFELERDGDATLLTLCHSRQGRRLARSTAAGWHAHLDVLEGQLAGDPRKWDECYAVERARYEPVVSQKLG